MQSLGKRNAPKGLMWWLSVYVYGYTDAIGYVIYTFSRPPTPSRAEQMLPRLRHTLHWQLFPTAGERLPWKLQPSL
jgi:hypothetical protein